MPELPEVQTVVNDLNKKIKGDTIVGFWSDWGKAIKNKSIKEFTKEITGRKIIGARRIGKNIFIDLSGGKTIYIHLKMTGHLLIKSKVKSQKSKVIINSTNNKLKTNNYFDDRVNQYIHHIWYLNSRKSKVPAKGWSASGGKSRKFDKTLEFSDLRKFGKIMLVDTDKVLEIKEIKELGIDAMNAQFTYEKFIQILKRRKNRPIGMVLMEQNLISGIGNIYRSEILFNAGINPERKAGMLSDDEKRKIFEQIKKVLNEAIKMRGTSDSDFRDTSGAPGNFQKMLKVYGREKEKCPECPGKIQRGKMGQRSFFYCSNCQK
jgi:formamidopyrimidine-DNA glycosylase